MNTAGLSLEQAPPFKSVARFFITAPIFGFIFGLFILYDGAVLFERFSTQTIAILHLFTIGFVLMSIFGALAQMLPVLAGVKVDKFDTIGMISYLSLVAGCLTFFVGFYFSNNFSKILALGLLLLSSVMYLIPILIAVAKADRKLFTVTGMGIAILFCVATILVGLHLLATHAFGAIDAKQIVLSNIHIIFSTIGFVSVLIFAVAYQVLPMFFVSQSFSNIYKKLIFLLVTTVLLIALLIYFEAKIQIFLLRVLPLLLIVLAAFGLHRLRNRKRKMSDVSLKYWQFGFICLIITSLVMFVNSFTMLNYANFLIGVLFGIGFLTSIIKAMLNKIVPFLVWFHLTSEGNFDVPNINELLPQKMARAEQALYFISFGFILSGVLWSVFFNIGGGVLSVSFLLLSRNLYVASSEYYRLSLMSK